jgi:hypothetical protein
VRQWFFTRPGHEGVFVSANVWFDARELARQLLDSNEISHIPTGHSVDNGDYMVQWFGSDMGSNTKRKVNQVYDGKKWSVI